MKKEITSAQLVAYLISNIDDVCDAFDCGETDLQKPLLELNAAPDLLQACKNMLEAIKECDMGVGTALFRECQLRHMAERAIAKATKSEN